MSTTAHAGWIKLSLRAVAVFVIINGISILLPASLIDSILVWCGVGNLPDSVLFNYLLRGAGFMLISFGVLIAVIASDVARYRSPALAVIMIFLLAAPVSIWIGAYVGMPRWWCMMDGVVCLLSGGVPLTLWLLPSRVSPNKSMDRTETANTLTKFTQ